MRDFCILLIVAVGLGAGTLHVYCDETKSPPSRIDTLIAQLGDKNYRQREAAMKELDAIGEPALDALRKATQNPDIEIAGRARGLKTRIEQRTQNALLLAPTFIEMTLKDATVDDAVAELSRQSGYTITLLGDKKKFAGRKVTLSTGKVPFWKALDMICEKAQLKEEDVPVAPISSAAVPRQIQILPVQPVPPPPPPKAPQAPQGFSTAPLAADPATPQKDSVAAQAAQAPPAPPPPAAPAPQAPAIRLATPRGQAPSVIGLADGKPSSAATHVEGAVRIRVAEGADVRARFNPPLQDEIPLYLSIRVEPKLQIIQVQGVKIEKALDNNEQELGQSLLSDNQHPVRTPSMPGQRIIPDRSLDQQTAMVRVKKGEKTTESLKELRGTVSLKIRTPAEEMVAIDNILNAKGRSAKGKADATLKIVDVKTDNGDIEIQVELGHSQEIQPARLDNPTAGPPANGNAPAPLVPAGPNGIILPYNYMGLDLVDAKGKSLSLVKVTNSEIRFQQNQRETAARLAFRPGKDQKADKLVFKGTRLASVDVPFILKDVPVK